MTTPVNPKTISWIAPTQNASPAGTPITAGEITGYMIGARDVNAAGSVAGTYPITATVNDPTALSAPITVLGTLAPGTYAASVMTLGPSDSVWDPTEAQFTIAPIPNPPSGFSVA